MRVVRGLVAAGVFALGLGCAGLTDMGMQLADGNLDVSEGAEAKLPDGFPLPAPAGGALQTVVSAGLMGTSTQTAIYELPAGADLDAALEPYRALMEAEGMKVSTQTSDETRVVTGVKDQTTWTVTVTPQGEQAVVTLTVAIVGT